MNIEEGKLLSKFEKWKGYKSGLFDNEDWAELDAFITGYKLAKNEGRL